MGFVLLFADVGIALNPSQLFQLSNSFIKWIIRLLIFKFGLSIGSISRNGLVSCIQDNNNNDAIVFLGF